MPNDNLPKNTEQMAISLENILPSLAKSLYGDDWRISIRELLQNAHDALVERTVFPRGEGPQIRIIPDLDSGTLTFEDNGIGMTLDDVRNYLATVGYGRKREQIEQMKRENRIDREALKNLIGQYGIGFLSSFIIAERVDVITKSLLTPEAPGVRAVFTGETKWYHEAAASNASGTKVVVRLKKQAVLDPTTGEATDLKKLLNFQNLQTQVRHFGDLLPYQVYVLRSPTDRSPVLANTTSGPWERPNCQANQLNEYLKARHPNENEPIWAEAFRLDQGLSAHGILYIPNPPRDVRASFESVARVDLFCRRMFITDDIPSLLPEWAKFIGAVVECPDLTPTLNRNNVVRHDSAFVILKQTLAKRIIDILIFLAEKQPKDFYAFLAAHTERLYTALLESWHAAKGGTEKQSFFGSFIKHLPFNVVSRSHPTGDWMTLPQYLKESAAAKDKSETGVAKARIYYLGNPSLWGQFRAMILQKDFPVIVPSGQAEPALIKAYGQTFPEEAEVEDVMDVLDLYVEKVDEAPYEQIMQFMHGLDGAGPDDVMVSRFSPNYVPAIMTIGSTVDKTQQAKAIECFLQQAHSVLDPKARRQLEEIRATSAAGLPTVVVTLNANNPLVNKLKEHCAQGKPLTGVAADVLHEIYHTARAVSDPQAAVSDHYFEHRNSLLLRLMELDADFVELESRYGKARERLNSYEKAEQTLPKDFESRNCALLLTDLRGSTRMVGFLDSAESARILKEYAEAIRRTIEEHGGRVEKFTGDGLFAYFWSADATPEKLTGKARDCALAVFAATEKFFAQPQVQDGLMNSGGIVVHGCRTVLHFGTVSAGAIAGSPTLVGRNVVALFRASEQDALFERSPVILSQSFVAQCKLASPPQALAANIVLDASLPRMTFYAHPAFAGMPEKKVN